MTRIMEQNNIETIFTTMEETIKNMTIAKGEKDGDIHRYWLPNTFWGTIDIHGATDILCAHVGEDGMLTFCVTDKNDSEYYFVGANELPIHIVEEIFRYMEEN